MIACLNAFAVSSSIQTILSASDFHRISRRLLHLRVAGYTAGRDFHPALKNLFNL